MGSRLRLFTIATALILTVGAAAGQEAPPGRTPIYRKVPSASLHGGAARPAITMKIDF